MPQSGEIDGMLLGFKVGCDDSVGKILGVANGDNVGLRDGNEDMMIEGILLNAAVDNELDIKD